MKSLSLLICGALIFSAVSAQSVISNSCNASQYPSGGYCIPYDRDSDKASADKNAAIDTGSTAWILAATALTMLITPAIGLFYAGLYRAEHATNTILLSFVGLSVITIEWILFGYSFSFGPGSKGYGNFKWGLYYHVAADPSGNYATAIPHILYAAFQNMFAAMAPVFLSGAVVGRMKFGTYIIYIILWTLIVYNCLAHWIWGNYIDPTTWQPAQLGWLNIRGTIDYAGGAVIHITAGYAALATAIVIGKRKEHNHAVRTFPQPHNLPLVAIGITLIWLGWFGYTGGANGTADGVAAHALINTQIAASTGLLWWLIIEYIVDRRTTLIGASYGALTGLVAITPAAGYIWPWASIMYGLFAVSFVYAFSRLKYILRYDDPFDVFAIHGIGGSVGMFMTGLFASPHVNSGIQGGAFYGPRVQLGYQMAGIVVASAFSFVCTFIIVFILKKTIGIRVPEAEEDRGLDYKYHGTPAYFFEEPVVEKIVHKAEDGLHLNTEAQRVNTEGQPVNSEGHVHVKKEEHVISS